MGQHIISLWTFFVTSQKESMFSRNIVKIQRYFVCSGKSLFSRNIIKHLNNVKNMKEAIRKELLKDLNHIITILQSPNRQEYQKLKDLSDHAIEDVALYKDLDTISITVLIYSLFKMVSTMNEEDYKSLLSKIKLARKALKDHRYRIYNQNIQKSFAIIKKSTPAVKQHLQSVLQAAKIRKGTVLLQKGLSLGQASGLMGLSNWDLQEYASKTTYVEQGHEVVSANTRLKKALQMFGVRT